MLNCYSWFPSNLNAEIRVAKNIGMLKDLKLIIMIIIIKLRKTAPIKKIFIHKSQKTAADYCILVITVWSYLTFNAWILYQIKLNWWILLHHVFDENSEC